MSMQAVPASVRSLSYAQAPPPIALPKRRVSLSDTPEVRSPSTQPPIPPPPAPAAGADDLLSAWRSSARGGAAELAPAPLSQARRPVVARVQFQ